MGSYHDFVRTHTGQNPKVRRLYWVCGDEGVLRNLVVKHIRTLANVDPFNVLVLSASDSSENEIWAALNQHALDSDKPWLLVVNEAQRLTQLERLVDWLKDARVRNSTAIFVSNDADWEGEERDVVMKSSNAYVVRCILPKDESERLKRAQEIIMPWGNIDRINAGILASRVGFNMAEARAVMDKAALFPEARVTSQAIEILAPRHVEQDIVWNLIGLNKRGAIEAAEDFPSSGVAAVLSSLGTHVEMLARIYDTLQEKKTIKELATELDARQQYVRLLLPYAKHYPRKDAVRRMMLLNRMDSALMSGAKEGVLQSLIALW